MKKEKKIGLALGGGGAKGLAHIGVIKMFERAGIPIDMIAGTSMGALVGAWYSLYKEVSSLEKIFSQVTKEKIIPARKFLGKNSGVLFNDDRIEKMLRAGFDGKEFNECQIPFAALATDVSNGDKIVIQKGSVSDAVQASISLPLIFPPVKIDSRLLMDGGFSDPVPADVVKKMGADIIIAVDVSSKWINISSQTSLGILNIPNLISEAFGAVEYQIAKETLKDAHVIIRPSVLSFSWLQFDRSQEIIEEGTRAFKENMKEIQKITGIHNEIKRSNLEKFVDFVFYDN